MGSLIIGNNMSFCAGNINVGVADILTAFDKQTIGTKVLDVDRFGDEVVNAVEHFDWSSCRQSGQALIPLPKVACDYVSGGVGMRTNNPDDYVVRIHRGEVGMYLRRYSGIKVPKVEYYKDTKIIKKWDFARSLAAPVDNVSVVVYTKEAYDIDPDITPEEIERTKGLTHILVAVLASSGQPSPLTPGRFIKNLAGGNLEAQQWTADEIRAKAKEIKEYSSQWCVVAD